MNFIKPGLEILDKIIKIEGIPGIILDGPTIILKKQLTGLFTDTDILKSAGIIRRNDGNPFNIIKLDDLISFIQSTISLFYGG